VELRQRLRHYCNASSLELALQALLFPREDHEQKKLQLCRPKNKQLYETEPSLLSLDSQEIPLILWSPKVHCSVCERPPNALILSQMNPAQTLISSSFKVKVKVEIKLFLCLVTHHVTKKYWGVEV